jgi:hypothetical protein
VASIALAVRGRGELARSWNDPEGSRGEGAVLLRGHYVLSDKSSSIARVGDLPPGGGTARLTGFWRIRGLDGKPEGLAFTRTAAPSWPSIRARRGGTWCFPSRRSRSADRLAGSAGARLLLHGHSHLTCGKPRFTPRCWGSGQRLVTTLPRV